MSHILQIYLFVPLNCFLTKCVRAQSAEVCPLSGCQKWGSEFLFWGGAETEREELHVSAPSPLLYFFSLNAPVTTFQRCSSSLVSLERFPLPPLEKTTAPETSEGVKDSFAISLHPQTCRTVGSRLCQAEFKANLNNPLGQNVSKRSNCTIVRSYMWLVLM